MVRREVFGLGVKTEENEQTNYEPSTALRDLEKDLDRLLFHLPFGCIGCGLSMEERDNIYKRKCSIKKSPLMNYCGLESLEEIMEKELGLAALNFPKLVIIYKVSKFATYFQFNPMRMNITCLV